MTINKSSYFPVVTSKYHHLRIWLWVFHMFSVVMLNKACNMSAGNIQLIYYPLKQLQMQHFDWTTSTSAARDENTFLSFSDHLDHEKVCVCDIFPSFLTANRSLCLDALKSNVFLSCITHAHFNKLTESRHACHAKSG